MTDLTPAARAVWEAFNSKFDWREDGVPGPQFHSIAAALRAAADQVEPDDGVPSEVRRVLNKILAIADELEGNG